MTVPRLLGAHQWLPPACPGSPGCIPRAARLWQALSPGSWGWAGFVMVLGCDARAGRQQWEQVTAGHGVCPVLCSRTREAVSQKELVEVQGRLCQPAGGFVTCALGSPGIGRVGRHRRAVGRSPASPSGTGGVPWLDPHPLARGFSRSQGPSQELAAGSAECRAHPMGQGVGSWHAGSSRRV